MDNGRKRIIRKIENDNDTVESSFFNVASLIMGGRQTMATEELRRQSARTSVEELCRYFHVPYEKSADRLDDVDVQIDRMLRPSGYMRRAVTLDEDWWKNSRSAMLCHAKDGTTVALIPRSYSGYTFFDYSQGKRLKVDAQTASLLTEKAVMFYRPLPQRALSRHDLFSFFLTLSNGRDYLLFLLLALALTALSLVMPWAIRFLFSKLVPVGEVSLVVTLFLMLSGVAVSQALVGVSRDLVRSRISLGVEDGFQSAVMARMMYFPSSFFSRYSSGELTEVTDAFNRLPSLMANLLLGSGLTVLLSLVYLAQIHLFGPYLVVPALTVLVVQLVLSVISIVLFQGIQDKKIRLESKLYAFVYNLYSGIQKVKNAGAEKRAFGRWASLYKEAQEPEYGMPVFLRVSQVIIGAVSLLGTIWFAFVGVTRNVSVPDFVAFNLVYGLLSGALLSFVQLASVFAQIRPALKIGKPLMETVPELTSGKQFVEEVAGKIEVNNVSFRYEDQNTKVFDDLSLTIQPGQYVAFVGRTGCGKSTLIRLLLGFGKPQEGAIYYDGKDINTLDLPSLRSHIGVVLQNGKLFSGDILSNITIMDSSISDDEVWRAAGIAGIADDIRRMPMGMYTHISEGPGGISGGQKQRIMIARALVSHPSVLIFDEAMSALDYLTQKKVSESLEKLSCTRIIVAHRLSTIRQCDRIFVLDGGRIAEEGTFDELNSDDHLFTSLITRQQL
ncbi:MAG: ATP-binding cassette domain-containing protein [Sphaerochaeta sp.]|jgi:NHLM bacteriocin system ABC transporter ATP-binding protein|nr:ATP-binding cassette domain-containing protein [Sphaerochaeta sp.]